jgi:hypothetical protein
MIDTRFPVSVGDNRQCAYRTHINAFKFQGNDEQIPLSMKFWKSQLFGDLILCAMPASVESMWLSMLVLWKRE